MQLSREGRIVFHDAQLNVWEEGIPRDTNARDAWERDFKRDVFLRIVQQLNRLGWKCTVPKEMITQYSKSFAERNRFCTKGDIKGDLSVSGRSVEFKMFQSVNCPTRPDYEGRYEYDKEAAMPYLIRLEMERTRRHIRDYLCNVFDGYVFDASRSRPRIGPGAGQVTAMETAAHSRKTSGHYVAELDRARISCPSYAISSDGQPLENGVQVYAMTHKGRMISGKAFYSLSGQWQIVSGKYGLEYVHHNCIWVNYPSDLRERRDTGIRRRRLEGEMAKAIGVMNFERAATLRDIIFPKEEKLYMLLHKEHKLYHRPGRRGYTNNQTHAGKFTWDEICNHDRSLNEVVEVA